jgi:Tfp pilus assembly protein PilP
MVGKRDPFASIIRTQTYGGSGCASGKRCLEVEQIVLKGVIKSPEGMVALVENQRRRSYFLHENDPIFNAEVVRITKDSIVLRENVTDKLGHVKVREVVKRLGVAGPEA